MSSSFAQRRPLGELLVERGFLERTDLQRALQLQRVLGGRLGVNLLDLALVSEDDLLSTLGRQFDSGTVGAADLTDIPPAILKLIPEHLVRRHCAIPFAVRGNTIHLAVKDPIDMAREAEISDATARLTRSFLGLDLRIENALDAYYRGSFEQAPRYSQIVRRLEIGVEQAETRRPSASELLEQHWQENDDSALADTAGIPIQWTDNEPAPIDELGAALDDSDGLVIQAPEATEEIVLSNIDVYEARSAAPRSPVSLIAAKKLLGDARNRHVVAQIALDSCARAFRRRVLLSYREGRLRGWAADGRGLVPHRFDNLAVSLEGAPPFLAVQRGADFWLGPLGRSSALTPFIAALGGETPPSCLILPVRVGSRLVGFLYADNLEDGVVGAPISELQSLTRLMGSALESVILRKKIGAEVRQGRRR
ncbi:MAG: hypothetical protein AAGA81_17850 [Acidobacteriota bacterium]